MDNYLIGVDGGGSGCRAALADRSGRVLAQSDAGPANVSSDFDTAVANIRAALIALPVPDGLVHFHIGTAGAITPALRSQLAEALVVPSDCVSDDQLTTLWGATGGEDGAVAAIGTGSFVATIQDGWARFSGGWGLRAGDQASGAWLGMNALQNSLLAHDGIIPPCGLTTQLMDRYGSPIAIAQCLATADAHILAELAPVVVHAAQTGDALAIRLMQDGADYIAKALGGIGHRPEDPLYVAGGLGPHYAPYLLDDLTATITPAKGSALDGALMLARQRVEKETA